MTKRSKWTRPVASKKTNQELLITTRMKDLVSKGFRNIGKAGKLSAANIAAGFVAATAVIAGMRVAVRAVSNVIKSLTIDVAEQGDALAKMSSRIGASVEALSEYKHVAELSGVAFNTLTMAWQRQTRRIAEAAVGMGEAQKALVELGLSAESLNKLAPEDQFEVLAMALEGVSNQADRVRLAMKFWDAEGVQLVQIVNQGSEAIRAMKGDASDLGRVFTEEAAVASEKFNDAMKRMNDSIDGVKQSIALELLPILTEAFDDITELVVGNKDEFKRWGDVLRDDTIPSLIDAAKWTFNLAQNLSAINQAVKDSKLLSGKDAGFANIPLLGGLAGLAERPDTEAAVGPGGVPNFAAVFGESAKRNARDARQAVRSARKAAKDAAESAAKAAEIERGVFPPTSFPSAADQKAISGLGFGPTTVPLQGPQQAAPFEFDLASLNDELAEASELMGEWKVNTQEIDTTLEELAAGGLNTTANAFQSFFDAMLSGTANTAEAFSNMVTSILSSLAKMAANRLVMQIIGAIAGAFAPTGGATQLDTSNFVQAGAGSSTSTGGFAMSNFATGGVVPGRLGQPQLALVHGGEEVLTPAQRLGIGGGGSPIINMTINPSSGMDERQIGEIAAAAVLRKARESRGFRGTLRGHAKGGLY